MGVVYISLGSFVSTSILRYFINFTTQSHMLKQFYTDKVICIIGYQTLLAKLIIKKLLIDLQYSKKIYLLKIEKNTKHQ